MFFIRFGPAILCIFRETFTSLCSLTIYAIYHINRPIPVCMKSVPPIHFAEAEVPEAVAAVQAIRKQVFVEEQGIPVHREVDGFDSLSIHMLGRLPDNTPVAVARLTMLKPEIGLITRVAVLPAYRGKGYGQALLSAIEDRARAEGALRLAVKPHSQAEGFYARLGYLRGDAPPDPVEGYSLVTMEKSL